MTPESKIEAGLLKKTGVLEVQVFLSKWSPDILAKLKKLGLRVDDSDKGLKVVFGRVDRKVLLEIAKVEEVTRIQPL